MSVKPIKKDKTYFDVKIECLLPSTLSYRVLAESPEEALSMTKTLPPNNVQYRLAGRKNLKATVYDAGTLMVRLVKNIMGKII